MNYSLSSFGRGFVLGMGAMSADILYFVLLSLGVLLLGCLGLACHIAC
nr:hypothetical protein [uncultured Campylobacter sp.]